MNLIDIIFGDVLLVLEKKIKIKFLTKKLFIKKKKIWVTQVVKGG